MSASYLLLLLCISFVFAARVPDPFGASQDYNAYSLSTFNGCNSDVEGRVAAFGDVTLQSYSVGLKLADSALYSLVSAGNVQWTDGSCLHGGVVGATVALSGVDIAIAGNTYTAECCSQDDCSACSSGATSTVPFDFVSNNVYLKQLSALWSSLPANGVASGHIFSLSFTCIDGPYSLNVFSDFSLTNVNSISFFCDATQTIIVNYPSDVAALGNIGFHLGSADQSKIIHHFTGAALTVSGVGLPGTLFAPNTAVSLNGGVTYGSLIAGSFGDNLTTCNGGQINYVPFTGCAPTPTPTLLCCHYYKRYELNGPVYTNNFCTADANCAAIDGWGLKYAFPVNSCDACCDCS